MIILDEKMSLPPPPPYLPREPVSPPPFPHQTSKPSPTLVTLPPSILLKIVYETFTQTSSIERQRKKLYWLNMCLRLVCRAMYVACMHVLRSTYLPAYTALIRPPYTTDPFPLTSTSTQTTSDSSISPIQSLQRETKVLDLFIALKVREDVWADESEYHLERDESFRDLFDLMQPRGRMEDLIRVYGAREGVVSIPGSVTTVKHTLALEGNASASMTANSKGKMSQWIAPLPFAALSVSFSSRRVGVVLTTRERKRTIVEVQRAKDERLEVAAKKLVQELRAWLVNNPGHGVR